jgi:hypothetical protein
MTKGVPKMKAFLILLILCSGVVAQSRDNLKKKYGEPVSETFLVCPGVSATASYNSTVIIYFTTPLDKGKIGTA